MKKFVKYFIAIAIMAIAIIAERLGLLSGSVKVVTVAIAMVSACYVMYMLLWGDKESPLRFGNNFSDED